MKASNLLLSTAFVLLLLSLALYNFSLKAEYNKGIFRDPFKNFVDLDLKNFNSIEANASSLANVKIIQGPYRVRILHSALEYIKVKQSGKKLTVDVDFPKEVIHKRPYTMLISCPNLLELRADALYKLKGKLVIDTFSYNEYLNQNTVVEGFIEDSLSILQSNGSRIQLDSNRIKSLNAIVGKSPKSRSILNISNSNHIEKANLNIKNKSQLIIRDTAVSNLTYKFENEAEAILSGSYLNRIAEK